MGSSRIRVATSRKVKTVVNREMPAKPNREILVVWKKTREKIIKIKTAFLRTIPHILF